MATSSAQTAARMVSYVVANILLGRAGAAAPSWEAAVIAVAALGLAAVTLPTVGKLATEARPSDAVATLEPVTTAEAPDAGAAKLTPTPGTTFP